MENWVPASNSILSECFTNIAPEIPSSAISDKWVWALATIPILAGWLLTGITSSANINLGFGLTIFIIILNVTFLTLDSQMLKAAGRNVDSWLWMGVLLVPVYLFVRENKTNKNLAPGIVWCVLFFLDLFI